jgi:hypothetical protein
MQSNTTDIETRAELEEDDRDYYANSGHLVPLRDRRAQSREQKLMIKAGLNA